MRKHCTIIGSGLGGTLVANELAEHCDVSVIETGPKNGIVYPRFTEADKKLGHVRTFCHGAGGGTNLWHNGLMPIATGDVSEQLFRSALEDSQEFTDKAAERLHMPTGFSFTREYKRARAFAAESLDQFAATSAGVDALVYPKTFAPLKLKPSVNAYYGVTDVGFETTGSRAASVSFHSGGESIELKPDFLVMSCGSFGTPEMIGRLLEAAGLEAPDSGSGLIDHPMGFVGKVRFRKSVSPSANSFALQDAGPYEFRSVIRLKSRCKRYTAAAFLRPAVTMSNSLATYVYKSKLGASSGRERIRNAVNPRILHPDVVAEILSHLFRFDVPSRTYSVLFVGEQRERRGRVSGSAQDLSIDWSVSNEELAVYNEMVSSLAGMLSKQAERVEINDKLDANWLWSGAHHSGTTIMSESGRGHVNSDLLVSDFDNVFVCDASVIQEHSYANTGLTIGQLACRLADHISKL